MRLRPATLCAAIIGGSLLAGPAVAAADQTQGAAIMAAVVERDGTLVDGAGVKSVTKDGTGRYRVEFVRSIRRCLRLAGIGVPDGLTEIPLPRGLTSTSLFDDNEVRVQIRSTTTGADQDQHFHLLVFCPQ